MPVLLTEKPSPYETIPNRIRWTRQQCDMMRDSGLLTGRYELIDGEIISKMGQKPAHPYVIAALLTLLTSLFGIETVRIQSTIDLSPISPDYDEPEPVFVHRQPNPEGYSEITAYTADEMVSTLARPDAAVRVSDLLPPA